ncbi:hypothetical protein M758_11G054500 [Ceratodon purpureus]|nr:hypothetical protein M758_11G054500 [Ceratodon purpureus]
MFLLSICVCCLVFPCHAFLREKKNLLFFIVFSCPLVFWACGLGYEVWFGEVMIFSRNIRG